MSEELVGVNLQKVQNGWILTVDIDVHPSGMEDGFGDSKTLQWVSPTLAGIAKILIEHVNDPFEEIDKREDSVIIPVPELEPDGTRTPDEIPTVENLTDEPVKEHD
jgi:hypothetical protein